MKILHILSGRKAHTGTDVFGIDTALALKEQKNVEQFVICRPHESFLVPFSQAKIPVATVDFNKWNKWLMKKLIPRKILREIKSYTPDVITCWGNRTGFFLPRNSGFPVLEWDTDPQALKHNNISSYYMSHNPEHAEELKVATGRPDCVFFGNTFGTLSQDPPLSREEFGIPDDKPVILMLARMVEDKGVDLLIRAATELDAFLLLAGDGSELEAYRTLAKDLGLESRVCFTGWRNDRSALLDLADILALPSRDVNTKDTCPAAMSQAWYKNVPVVAARADGPRQYIQHGANGMLSEIDDVDGLRENLRAVLENNDLRERLIVGGNQTYETKFSKQAFVANLLKIYEEIMRRGVIKNQ